MAEKTLRISPKLQLPVDVVTEALGIVATRGAGKSYASAVLIEEAMAVQVQTVVVDVTGVYHGLRSNHGGDGPGLAIYVFGGPHGDLPLEPTAGGFIADLVVDSGQSFVLDLSDFSKTKARTFVADFLERLYERKARDRSSLLLVVDEADEFAPQLTRRAGGDAPRCLGAMETIAKRGRSRGIGIVMITQRTQALNKDELDLIETQIAMRQLAERSRDAVAGWIADKQLRDESGVIESLQALPTGTAWVWSPLRGILERVEIRRIRTFDSYRTPKPGERQVEPKARKQLDLDALGEQMRATVERAKANDPGELKKKIRELERQLQNVTLEERTVEVEKIVEVRVEVPVLDYEKFLQLQDAIKLEPLTELLEQLAGVRQAIWDGLETAREIARTPTDTKAAPAAPARHSSTSQRQPRAATGNPTEARRTVAAERSPRPGPRAATENGASGGGSTDLTGPQQRVLDAIAWYAALGVHQPGKTEVGFIAGYRVGKRIGGTYGNILGRLRSLGLIDYPSPGEAAAADLLFPEREGRH